MGEILPDLSCNLEEGDHLKSKSVHTLPRIYNSFDDIDPTWTFPLPEQIRYHEEPILTEGLK